MADGRLLPVTDLAAWLGRRAAGGRTLQLHPDVGIAGLRVDTVYGLSEAGADLSAHEPAGEPDGVPGTSDEEAVLSALTIVEEARQHRIVDLGALLQSPRFLDISATNA